ncbi:hypothetical protein [Porcipelethomonas sp.]|uniref:hypothetical protein n=1 Tax=Porcipelethomonas sp. TaxID=2981675 RepID=UPI003EF12314
MHKVFKPGEIRNGIGAVKIPDMEFKIEDCSGDDDDAKKKEQALKDELYKQITEEVKNECQGEIGRKKIIAQKKCDVMLRDARTEADKIISDAKAESERIINDASSMSEKIKQDAYNEGRNNGLTEKSELLEHLAHYISQSIEEIKGEQEKYFEEYSNEIKHLAVAICEKIIAQKIEDDDLLMYNVIKDAVKSVRDVKWIKAEVSSKLAGYVDSLEKELSTEGQNIEFVLSDDAPKDTCVLNTSSGVVVATLSVQLHNLKDFINNLDKGDNNEDQP